MPKILHLLQLHSTLFRYNLYKIYTTFYYILELQVLLHMYTKRDTAFMGLIYTTNYGGLAARQQCKQMVVYLKIAPHISISIFTSALPAKPLYQTKQIDDALDHLMICVAFLWCTTPLTNITIIDITAAVSMYSIFAKYSPQTSIFFLYYLQMSLHSLCVNVSLSQKVFQVNLYGMT